jgi:hypothetical protein
MNAEHRFLALGWRDPVDLAHACDCLALRVTDFGDRLVGVVVGYLRTCFGRRVAPDLDECERLLTERAVPRSAGELYAILQEPTVGESITDLALAVQQAADSRTDELCRSLTRDALKAVKHAFDCADCIQCQQGNRRTWTAQTHGLRSALRGRVIA